MSHHKQNKRQVLRFIGISLFYLFVLQAGLLGWIYVQIPDTIYLAPGQNLQLARFPFLTEYRIAPAQNAALSTRSGTGSATVSLGGYIPIKQVNTVITDRPTLLVCGTPFGIKMFSEGALIVAFSDIHSASGPANPAKEAGLQIGDRIIQVNGVKVSSNQELASALNSKSGKTVVVTYLREGTEHRTQLTPLKDENGRWKAGMWVRDSSAGVGTLTFVDEQKGIFGGLGHSISDSDTGERIALRSGEIVACTITGYEKGIVGNPGELKGRFSTGLAIGSIQSNHPTGIYGTIRTTFSGKATPIAFAQEVKIGTAQILTTIEGDTPNYYSVEIERIHYNNDQGKHNLVIHVTDSQLLDTTGGIVQGMSGSPIIQDGRLVGAVTHVLVNDPTRGYGIFIENMLDAAG